MNDQVRGVIIATSLITVIVLIMIFGVTYGSDNYGFNNYGFNESMKFDYLCTQNQTCIFNFNSTNSTMIMPSIIGRPL